MKYLLFVMTALLIANCAQTDKPVYPDVHEAMEELKESWKVVKQQNKEDWKLSGIDGAGFWSRWYLWSHPNFEDVRKFMTKRFGIKFI